MTYFTHIAFAIQIAALSRRLSGCPRMPLQKYSQLLIFLKESFMFSKSFCVGLLPPFILAVAASAHAQSFPRERLGDNELNCQALYDEVKQMDATISASAPSQPAAANQAANTTKAFTDLAVRETRSGEVAQFGNLLGRLTAGFGGDPQQVEANKALARSSAAERKQYLTSLFNGKKCKVSTLRK